MESVEVLLKRRGQPWLQRANGSSPALSEAEQAAYDANQVRTRAELARQDAVAAQKAWQASWDGLALPRKYWGATLDEVDEATRPEVIDYCENITVNVENGMGLTACGGLGTGKSNILALVGMAAIDAGIKGALYATGTQIADWTQKPTGEEVFPGGDRWETSPLLLSDDFELGAAWPNGIVRLTALLSSRHANLRATIQAINCPWEEFAKNPENARIADRLRHHSRVLNIGGKSRRISLGAEAGEAG